MARLLSPRRVRETIGNWRLYNMARCTSTPDSSGGFKSVTLTFGCLLTSHNCNYSIHISEIIMNYIAIILKFWKRVIL